MMHMLCFIHMPESAIHNRVKIPFKGRMNLTALVLENGLFKVRDNDFHDVI